MQATGSWRQRRAGSASASRSIAGHRSLRTRTVVLPTHRDNRRLSRFDAAQHSNQPDFEAPTSQPMPLLPTTPTHMSKVLALSGAMIGGWIGWSIGAVAG